jgi:hypothetical protein
METLKNILTKGKLMPKKKWLTPLLTVLVRGKPEEKVLVGCKGPGYTGAFQNVYGRCQVSGGLGFCGTNCNVVSSS